VTSTPILTLIATIMITALSGCLISKHQEPSTRVPQASNRNVDLAHLAPPTMLQPERHMLNGVNDMSIFSSQQITGLFEEEVQKLFGVPDFKHYDPPAEIWQYRKEKCLLDIFLYVDKQQSNKLRVRHAEVRSRSINKISQENCFLQALHVKH
jgi:hypothetical protein